MLLRIVSALVLIPVALAIVVLAPSAWFLASMAAVGTLCLYEYFELTRRMGMRGQPICGYAGFYVALAGLRYEFLPLPALGLCLVLVGFLAAMWRRGPMRDRVSGLMANLLGVAYFSLALYSAWHVRHGSDPRIGLQWTLLLLAVIWTGDTAALFCGRSFGRTRFAPQLSPKKTNEGAAGGLLAGVLVAAVLRYSFMTDLDILHVIVASTLIGAFGQLGDLAESMLKRAADVKESSNLIPGHGGILDRIDSLLFAFPVLYIYLQLISNWHP
jgi:phosphatidate cytidylyltransferase